MTINKMTVTPKSPNSMSSNISGCFSIRGPIIKGADIENSVEKKE